MHTIEIPDIEFKVEIPSEVSELDPEQASFVMEQILLLQSGKIAIDQFRINLISFFLNLKMSGKYVYFRNKKNKTVQEKQFIDSVNENVFRISETMESFFIAGDDKHSLVFNYDTVKNLIPQIGKYYGPAAALTDCTFYEYKEPHIRFVEFCKGHDEQKLNELVAVLYRPKRLLNFLLKYLPGHDGQMRRKLIPKTNPRYFEKRVRKIAKVPYNIRFAVYMYFQKCEEYLYTGKPEIDGQEIDLGVLYQGAKSSKGKPDIGLTGIMYSLAETNVFGNIEETANTNLYDILARLYQLKIAYDKLTAK
jgi:hypothetical protein